MSLPSKHRWLTCFLLVSMFQLLENGLKEGYNFVCFFWKFGQKPTRIFMRNKDRTWNGLSAQTSTGDKNFVCALWEAGQNFSVRDFRKRANTPPTPPPRPPPVNFARFPKGPVIKGYSPEGPLKFYALSNATSIRSGEYRSLGKCGGCTVSWTTPSSAKLNFSQSCQWFSRSLHWWREGSCAQ